VRRDGLGISSFQAFCVSLGARVGTGNLAGVASAIAVGGPGAVFWMWVMALFGAATAFAEAVLAQLYKRRGEGSFFGGPAYYMKYGLRCAPMGVSFATVLVLNQGMASHIVQSNAICGILCERTGAAAWTTALVLAALALGVFFGGVWRVSRVIVVNSPNNPTGRVLREDAVRGIAALAVKHDIFVISDEVYRSLVYDGIPYLSIFDLPEMKGRCSVIDAVSKHFSMTGYRLGFTIGPRELIETMTRLQENINACAPLPSQYAAIAAYGEDTDTSYLKAEYDARRRVVIDGVRGIDGLSIDGVDAAFYAFVNISTTGMDSQTFAYNLLKEQRVAVVPGLAYGDAYDNFIRIAFTVSADRLRTAIDRLRAFV